MQLDMDIFINSKNILIKNTVLIKYIPNGLNGLSEIINF